MTLDTPERQLRWQLKDPKQSVRAAAAREIGNRGLAGFSSVLTDMLGNGEHWEVKKEAVRALEKTDPETAKKILPEEFFKAAPAVQKVMAEALVEAGGEREIETVVDRLVEDEKARRQSADIDVLFAMVDALKERYLKLKAHLQQPPEVRIERIVETADTINRIFEKLWGVYAHPWWAYSGAMKQKIENAAGEMKVMLKNMKSRPEPKNEEIAVQRPGEPEVKKIRKRPTKRKKPAVEGDAEMQRTFLRMRMMYEDGIGKAEKELVVRILSKPERLAEIFEDPENHRFIFLGIYPLMDQAVAELVETELLKRGNGSRELVMIYKTIAGAKRENSDSAGEKEKWNWVEERLGKLGSRIG